MDENRANPFSAFPTSLGGEDLVDDEGGATRRFIVILFVRTAAENLSFKLALTILLPVVASICLSFSLFS